MRKIISSILAVALLVTCFSIVSFAGATDALYFGDGSGAVTATEDTISIDVYLNPTSDMATMWISGLEGTYAVTNGSVSAVAKVNGLTNLTDTSSRTSVFYYTSGDSYEPTAGAAVKVANITIAREGTATTSEVSFSKAKVLDFGGTEYTGYTTGSITITWPSNEEVFEPTYEGVKAADGSVTEGFASGSKVATVFAKAETALTAGTYGIVFGGQKYVGAADVAEGKYWVIRLYDPEGKILTGTYDCQKFVGNSSEAVDYKLETK